MLWFMLLRSLVAGLVLAVIAAAAVEAEDVVVGDLKIVRPYAFPSIGKATSGAGFLVIENGGAATDYLIGVESKAAARTELHRHERSEGVKRMRRLQRIAVPAKGRVALAPGGYHVMLIGLTAPLVAGGKVPIELIFERAGRVPVTLSIHRRGGR